MCASWFSKKESSPTPRDYVYANSAAKFRGVKNLLSLFPNHILIAWFPGTLSAFQQFATEQGIEAEISLAREVNSFHVTGKTVLFLEHYPLSDKETSLVQSWNADGIIVLSALDEPLFVHFAGERLSLLLHKMGLKEDESLQHVLITEAIHNAQQKLAKKITVEHSANSMEEWFRKNI